MRGLLPVLTLEGMTLATSAQYQLQTEINPEGTLTVYEGAACPSGALVIPATIHGRRVTRIKHLTFAGCAGLTDITTPETSPASGTRHPMTAPA